MGLLCRLFGHKIRREEYGDAVMEVCARLNCDHHHYERRRPLRFGSPDDHETPMSLRQRDYEPFDAGGAAPTIFAAPSEPARASIDWIGGGGESGGGGASASWDSAPSVDFSDVSSSVSSTESFSSSND